MSDVFKINDKKVLIYIHIKFWRKKKASLHFCRKSSPLGKLFGLLLFCLVLSGPLLASQQAGCTQKLRKLELFDHVEQGPFSTQNSQQLTAQIGGKQSFLDDAVPFTTSSLKNILANLRKSQLALLF